VGRRLIGGVLFGVAVYVAIVLWADGSAIAEALGRFSPKWLVLALVLAAANWGLRFLKWQRYLRDLSIEVDARTSLLIFLGGFSMAITPGKMGEVFKSWMLRRKVGIPVHTSAPIVVAERITDLLGYLLLMAGAGLASYPEYQWIFWSTLAVVGVGIAFAGSRRVAGTIAATLAHTPYLWRYKDKVRGSFESTRVLLAPRALLAPTLISVLAWGLECVAFYFVASAWVDGYVPFAAAVFAYAASAVAGAVAIIVPGGLGVTEGSLSALLTGTYQALAMPAAAARGAAVSAVLVIRLATLWFAVLVGLVCVWLFERHMRGAPEADSA